MKKKDALPLTRDNVISTVLTKQDISFTHSVFAQCFLPFRKLPEGKKIHTVKHGKASFAVQAGVLLNPETGDLIERDVPYGSAARVILAHIHNHVIKSASLDQAQDIPMGTSLRDFFSSYHLKIGGKNGKQITDQVNNIAAARITLGMWNGGQAKQINMPTLAEEIDFWLEKDTMQRTLWQPTMILNRKYVETVRERPVPIDMRALIGLYEKPRAMDLFTWLSYRLPTIKSCSGILIPFFGENGLHTIFGSSIKQKHRFKSEFIKTIEEIHRWYPEATIGIEEKGIRLYKSASPIPDIRTISNDKSQFFFS